MTESLSCPECGGIVSVVECETEQTIVPGYFVVGVSRFETRLRPCTAIACNACEFMKEINPKTGAILNA